MNLQVAPKPYTLIESLKIPLKGPLKEPPLITSNPESLAGEPQSRITFCQRLGVV